MVELLRHQQDFKLQTIPAVSLVFNQMNMLDHTHQCVQIRIDLSSILNKVRPGPSIDLKVGRVGDDGIVFPGLISSGVTRNGHEYAHIFCQEVLELLDLPMIRQGSLVNEVLSNSFYKVFYEEMFNNEIRHESEEKKRDLIYADIREALKYMCRDYPLIVSKLNNMRDKGVGIRQEFKDLCTKIISKFGIIGEVESVQEILYKIHSLSHEIFTKIKEENVFVPSDDILQFDDFTTVDWLIQCDPTLEIKRNEIKDTALKVLKICGDAIFFKEPIDIKALNSVINSSDSRIKSFLQKWEASNNDGTNGIMIELEERPRFVMGLLHTLFINNSDIQSEITLKLDTQTCKINSNKVTQELQTKLQELEGIIINLPEVFHGYHTRPELTSDKIYI